MVKNSLFTFLDSPESSLHTVQIAIIRGLLSKPLGAPVAIMRQGKAVMVNITTKHQAYWQKTLADLKEPT